MGEGGGSAATGNKRSVEGKIMRSKAAQDPREGGGEGRHTVNNRIAGINEGTEKRHVNIHD